MESLFQLKQQRETNKILQGHVPTQAGAGGNDPPQMDGDARQSGPLPMDRHSHESCWITDKVSQCPRTWKSATAARGRVRLHRWCTTTTTATACHITSSCRQLSRRWVKLRRGRLPIYYESKTCTTARRQYFGSRWPHNGSHTRATIFYHGTTGKAATRHLTSMRCPPRVWLCSTRQQPC